MNKAKWILPLSIVAGCLILGGFFYAVQVSKHRSIEHQQLIDLQANTNAERAKQAQEAQTEALLADCLNQAEVDYWTYMGLNATSNKNSVVTAPDAVWNRAKSDKQTAIENCYKRYK